MSVMWEPLTPQNFENGLNCYNCFGDNSRVQNAEPWFKSIFNTVIKYKNELFGGHHNSATAEMQQQRTQEYAIPVNYKFVFALFTDGFFRPGAIVGKNKKQQEFVVYFYHNKKCCCVKRKNIVLKHGNLLDRKVFFCHCGQKKKAKVYGNNAPANNGFPSIFYLKKKGMWYKIFFKSIFLSRKLIRKCNLDSPKKKSQSSFTDSRPEINPFL